MVNNFSIAVATVNGTGSQTANLALLRAIFKMGVPVSGKNVFPSNIQGQPTWFYIRVSEAGYEARREKAEILAAFNRVTADADIAAVTPGGVCLYPAEWPGLALRDDLHNHAVPVSSFLREAGISGKIKDYVTNMVYLGALAQLLAIPLRFVEESLAFHFGQRQELVDQNMAVVQAAFDWLAKNVNKADPFRVVSRELTAGNILITGNEAAALGSVFGGVGLASWYPITPSTSLIDALNDALPRLRTDPDDGKPTYAVIQAEDELAAAGMVMGAGWAGVRAMTATSGPGLSLMSEFVSLGYFAEIPSVIWDVQRVGPSTGLPTRTSQGDILFAYYLGHGDTKNVLLLPATVAECFEFGYTAFDLAEELQTPILVMSDLDLGMNTWMSKPFVYPAEPMKRGKVLTAEQVAERGFARYLDIDGDGIPYRTIPGNQNPDASYFNRGTGHNAYAVYSERPDDWRENMARLSHKFDTARQMVPAPVIERSENSTIAIIAFGSTLPAVVEARAHLAERGVGLSFLRLRALPINQDVHDFVAAHQHCFVLELNRDGQVCQILTSEMPELGDRLISLAYLDGRPLSAEWLVARLDEAITSATAREIPVQA